MKIYNGLAHELTVFENSTYVPELRKWVGGNVVKILPKMKPMNVHTKSVYAGEIGGIPLFKRQILGAAKLPYGYDIYIVSAAYAAMYELLYAEPAELYVVSSNVYDIHGVHVLGCRGIQRYQASL